MIDRSRLGFAVCTMAVMAAWSPAFSQTVSPENDLPIIVTYELRKQREAEVIVARNPKGFWIHQIVTRIEDKKPDLEILKQPAVVQVTFVVAHDGHLVSKAILKSSGDPVADKTAIAMLDQAAPFPPMPAAMPDAELAFNLPVRFH